MSVNTVTGGSIALQTLHASLQDHKNQLNQAQQSLQQSLSVGNLDGAQKAYDTLSKLIQNGPGGQQGNPFGGNKTLQNDFKAIGDALKSGDANSAQKAYAQFTQDLQSAQQARQHSGQADSDGDHDNSGVSGPGLYA